MDPIPLNLVFEDQLSEFVMIKLADHFNKYVIANSYSESGIGYIKRNLKGFNEASKGCPFFVLVDLDNVECAPTLMVEWLNRTTNQNLIFRVAVREVEAWLLADIDGFSEYFGIPKSLVLHNYEKILNPKEALIQLVRRCRKRVIREDIVPKDEFAKIGPNYNGRLGDFVINHWNIERAMFNSDSLSRAFYHLERFKTEYR